VRERQLITGFVAKDRSAPWGVSTGREGRLKPATIRKASVRLRLRLAFMVFVLYTPCLATVVTLWRESGALKWMLFSVTYQLILAWTAAWVVLHLGRLAGLG
jgi:ferrous iron transport protein B